LPRSRNRILFLVVVGISLVVLFTPGPAVPEESLVSDKVGHAALFAALAVTGRLARVRLGRLLVGLVLYAGASEVLQAVLPIARDGDVRDVLADVSGIAVGLVGLALVTRLRQPNV
jgi:membrane associated rhomboid family serine protease